MTDLLQGQSIFPRFSYTPNRLERSGEVPHILGGVAIVLLVAGVRFLRPRTQLRISLYSPRHVLLNAIGVAGTLLCLVVNILSAVHGCRQLESIVSALVWSLVLTLRLAYFSSKSHRRALHALATSTSLVVVFFSVLPGILVPLATQNEITDVNIDTLQLVYLASTVVVSIILPVITPSHDVGLPNGGQAHTSSTCSALTRWWTYGWVSPLIASAYRTSGKITLEELPSLDEESRPERWLAKFHQVRRKHTSTPRALWQLFRCRILVMSLFMILCGCCEFLGTIGLTSILTHLAGSPRGTPLRSWFAASLFGISPIIRGLCMQTFEFHSTRNICHLKSMVIHAIYQKLLKQRPGARPDAGRVTSLVAADTDKIATLRYTLMAAFLVPTEITVASVLLYRTIGWSYIPGLAVLLLTRIPISWLIGRYQEAAQGRVMAAIDARVRRVAQAVKGLQTVKFLGLEDAFGAWIDELRKKEMDALWHKLVIITASDVVSGAFTLVPLVLSLGFYTLVAGQRLTPDVVFTVVAIFNTLKGMMALAVVGVSTYAQAFVSLRRLAGFLDDGDVAEHLALDLDMECERIARSPYSDSQETGTVEEPVFGAREAAVCLDQDCEAINKTILKNVSFNLVPGGLNAITGELGTGKSTLIKALLNEMPVVRGVIGARIFPGEVVSYAGQAPWLKGRSVREAILFHSPFSKARYEEVLQDLGLDIDLQSIPNGDLGDLGANCAALSGGQKARVALARAIYAETRTILLDDILAALDMTTTTLVVERCLLGPLVRGRTVVLVTSNPRCLQAADLVIRVADGTVTAVERPREPQVQVLRVDREEETSSAADSTGSENDTLATESPPTYAKLMSHGEYPRSARTTDTVTEPVLDGLIGKLYALNYMKLFGSRWALGLLCTLVLSVQAVDVAQSFWLTIWSEASQNTASGNSGSPTWYLGIYGGLGVSQLVLASLASVVFFGGALRASRTEHRRLVSSVLGATFSWITATPGGQILNRFSADMFSLDNTVTELLKQVVDNFLAIAFRLVAVSSLLPTFLAPAMVLLGLGMFTGQVYLYGSTASKRLYAACMSPLLVDIADSISGIEVIRAHGVQYSCRQDFIRSLEAYLRGWEAVSACQRWFAVRMDFLVGLISLSTAVLALSTVNVTPEVVGFSMTSSITLCSALLYAVYLSSLLEVEMSSFQRIEEYIHRTPQEQRVAGNDTPPPAPPSIDWPSDGRVELRSVTASYATDSNPVLWDIDLAVKPGTCVALVGRSGSGKSSLAATILRLTTKLRGDVFIDGTDINNVDLSLLRRKISFIPQDPTLFAGTLRLNIDFLGERSDAALQGLLDAVMGGPMGAWSLDHIITANGSNLSQGERQLVAMVRALASDSRILIIDEATASLDAESESRIQRVLRKRFHNKTVIAIAHKLSTVVDFDQVVVLDQGRIAEEGEPRKLIESGTGLFGDFGKITKLTSQSEHEYLDQCWGWGFR